MATIKITERQREEAALYGECLAANPGMALSDLGISSKSAEAFWQMLGTICDRYRAQHGHKYLAGPDIGVSRFLTLWGETAAALRNGEPIKTRTPQD